MLLYALYVHYIIYSIHDIILLYIMKGEKIFFRHFWIPFVLDRQTKLLSDRINYTMIRLEVVHEVRSRWRRVWSTVVWFGQQCWDKPGFGQRHVGLSDVSLTGLCSVA